jgi:hypothetical protein
VSPRVNRGKEANLLIAEGKTRARKHSLVQRGIRGTALKHGLSLSAGLAVIASATVYLLAYFLFTIHEEIGISADAAFPLALWTFPAVFLGSLVAFWVRNARPGKR